MALDTVTEQRTAGFPSVTILPMTIRRGTAADAAVLAALAHDTFFETFAATNDATDMALHLARAYGMPQQTAELWRFYVTREWHGRGIAQALMASVVTEAAGRGGQTHWLGVWERNSRARAFYGKCGFADVGEHVFLFGTDPQTDRVMVRPL